MVFGRMSDRLRLLCAAPAAHYPPTLVWPRSFTPGPSSPTRSARGSWR
jgi:hypothetical protein